MSSDGTDIWDIEAIDDILPTNVLLDHISVLTNAIKPCPSQVSKNRSNCVWSPHFEWIIDCDGIFNKQPIGKIEYNVVYQTWIAVNRKMPSCSRFCLIMVESIADIARDQMNVLDAPWNRTLPVYTDRFANLHSLLNRQRGKVNTLVKYAGVAVWCEERSRELILWSRYTGIVYVNPIISSGIKIGSWVDYSVKYESKSNKLLAVSVRLSKNHLFPTRVHQKRAQVCHRLLLPHKFNSESVMIMSDFLGRLWFHREEIFKAIDGKIHEILGRKIVAWLAPTRSGSDACWHFFAFANKDEVKAYDMHQSQYMTIAC